MLTAQPNLRIAEFIPSKRSTTRAGSSSVGDARNGAALRVRRHQWVCRRRQNIVGNDLLLIVVFRSASKIQKRASCSSSKPGSVNTSMLVPPTTDATRSMNCASDTTGTPSCRA